MGYFFLTARGIESVENMGCSRDGSGTGSLQKLFETGVAVKCSIVKGYLSKCVFGHIVPKRGIDEDGFQRDGNGNYLPGTAIATPN